MKQLSILFLALAALVVALMSGCTDSAPSSPTFGLGSVTVTKYVAIGNSLTAGYQSNALYESAQIYSFPNLIAGQLVKAHANIGKFEQPIYSDPGTPDPATGKAARYEIISLVGPIIGPKGLPPGSPRNTALPRPYDNLGIPGIPLAGFMDTTGTYTGSLGPLVLRSSYGFPKSVFQQVVMLNPDLITFWLGANDVLGFAVSGGTSPSAPTDPTTIFGPLYTQALTALHTALPNAKIIVGNIPDVTAVPFFTTVNPVVAAKIPAIYYLRYQKHGNSGMSMDSTKLTEANAPLITLKGKSYASLLGQTTGQFYRDLAASMGITIDLLYPTLQAGFIDTTKPFGFHPQNPWPDALILDASEQSTASTAIAAFNNIIATTATAIHAYVVDFNGFFNNVAANGLSIFGETYTTEYITGQLFSLDGVHPSSRGNGIMANEWIKVMNAAYGMNIQQVDITTLPRIEAPLSKVGKGMGLRFTSNAFDSFKWLFRQSNEY